MYKRNTIQNVVYWEKNFMRTLCGDILRLQGKINTYIYAILNVYIVKALQIRKYICVKYSCHFIRYRES